MKAKEKEMVLTLKGRSDFPNTYSGVRKRDMLISEAAWNLGEIAAFFSQSYWHEYLGKVLKNGWQISLKRRRYFFEEKKHKLPIWNWYDYVWGGAWHPYRKLKICGCFTPMPRQFVQTVITQVYFGVLEVNQTMRPSKTSPCPAFQTELNGEKTEMKCNPISQHVF